jgi:hypothetical protein
VTTLTDVEGSSQARRSGFGSRERQLMAFCEFTDTTSFRHYPPPTTRLPVPKALVTTVDNLLESPEPQSHQRTSRPPFREKKTNRYSFPQIRSSMVFLLLLNDFPPCPSHTSHHQTNCPNPQTFASKGDEGRKSDWWIRRHGRCCWWCDTLCHLVLFRW